MSVPSISGASASTNSATSIESISATQDRFLKLLVTQMKNQDPLNPMDNSQVTSQMAQLSTVTGINKLSELVSGLSASYSASQSLQAASMIGHGALVAGDSLQLADGNAIAAVDLPQAVEALYVTIKDAAGATVHSANLGPQSSGITSFQWDGKTDAGGTAASGNYSYEVQAVAAGKTISSTALAYGKVGSVTLGAQGVQLNVDGIGAVGLSQIKQIL